MVPAGRKQGLHLRLPILLGALLLAPVAAQQSACSAELQTYVPCYSGGHPPNKSCPYETQLMKLYSGVFPIITGDSNAPNVSASFQAYAMNSFKAFGDFGKCRSLQTAQWCVVAVGKDIGELTGWMSNRNDLIQLGTCVPSACSEEELNDQVASLLPVVAGLLGPGTDAKVHCGESRHDFDWKAAIMLCVCVLFGLLSAAGTIIEECERGIRLGASAERASAEPLLQPLMSDEEGISAQADTKQLRIPVALKKFMLHFALRRNWELFGALRKGSNTFGCLDGIRVLSMGWVVFGHVLVYSSGLGFANIEALYPPNGKLATDTSTQILASAFFSVDTFFWLSGFLTTYSLLKRTTANEALQGKAFFTKLYPLSIAARWLRLTPIYAFVMAFYGLLQPTFSGGPGWQSCRQNWGAKCDTDWFANLLYFNQFYPKWDENIRCMGHTCLRGLVRDAPLGCA
ncbi:hypothetical protein CYMTET_36065 [Cymbomonas tetramitiformis]|uniref:Acyltransferase 3 domain-containing protein n=1 Tax=Cymbomonas tetramitiformis TaxID=36881 RepID=A0AAE0KMX6_9CHLO|nr:hypothetical protein CYMTET_36065 [Cymbomonas tetramitiformis]